MLATRALRQAVAHGKSHSPLIKFVGKRHTPEDVDHTPKPHPASPSGSLPPSFPSGPISGNGGNSHASFSQYRDSAQQHGPLRKSIGSNGSIGSQPASQLGPVTAPKGMYFDRSELPARFRRALLSAAEIEAIETGGATLFG